MKRHPESRRLVEFLLWKHDTRNEAFWDMVAGRSDFGLRDGCKDTVLEFLVCNLSTDELDGGALAKINTAVYRIHRDSTTEQIMAWLSLCVKGS